MVRVALDFSPGVAQRAGIGRYTRELAHALAPLLGENLVLWYGRAGSAFGSPPAGTTTRPLPLPPEWLTRAWFRLRLPLPVELAVGTVDVVHGTDFLVPPARAPRVVTVHDLSFLLVPTLGFPRLVRFLASTLPRVLRTARQVITVSEAVRSDLVRLYRLDPERVHAIHHGVAPVFRPVPACRRTPLLASLGVRDPYVIAVGTIEPRKGYSVVLRAVEAAAQRVPDLQLVIVGVPGWLSASIEGEIRAAERRGRVVWLRGLPDETLAALYSGARAFLTASMYEGFNLPLLEALACGAPAIATDLAVHREVAGEAALYTAVDDPRDVARALATLLENVELADRLHNAALERAARFDWGKSARAHLAVYELAAQERRLRPSMSVTS